MLRCTILTGLLAFLGAWASQPHPAQAQTVYTTGRVLPERVKVMSLEWLARVQDPETGAWSLTGADARSKYSDGSARENRCQATALALLALQGRGSTHKKGDYPQQVTKAWAFLLKQQRADGSIADPDRHELILTHAQVTLALCEIWGMTKDPYFAEPAKKAIAFAIQTQDRLGGWGASLGPDGKSTAANTEVTCWMLLALQSARLSKLQVPQEVFDGVGCYLDKVQTDEGGCRESPDPKSPESDASTAQGLLARQHLGCRRAEPRLVAGVHRLLRKPPDYNEPDVTYWYFATQVVHHMEGHSWTKWSTVMRESVIEHQKRVGPENGSWSPTKPKPDLQASRGRLYVTCLATCMLEVYYRHLPIYSKNSLTGPSFESASEKASGVADTLLWLLRPSPETAIENLGGPRAFAETLGVTLHLEKGDLFQPVTRLDLSRSKLGDVGLKELGKLRHLETLNISATQVTDAGIQELHGLANLRRLNLARTPVTDSAIEKLKTLEVLEVLELAETRTTGAGIGEFQILNALDLAGSQANDAGLKGFRHLSLLRDLDLSGTKVSDTGLAELRGLTLLKRLNLSGTQVTDAGLGVLQTFTKLEQLELDNTQVTHRGLAKLAGLKSLEDLKLDGTLVTDEALAELKKLERLRSLSLRGAKITGVGLGALTKLEYLTLDDTSLSGAGVKELRHLVNLKQLKLNRVQLTDAGLEHLKPLVHLEWLELEGAKVTDAGLRHLNPFKSLNYLDLSGTPITDTGLKELSGLESLSFLNLSDTAITDVGLAHLQGLKELSHLKLANTRVHGKGLRNFTALLTLDLSGTPFREEHLEELRGLSVWQLDLSRTNVTDAGVKVLREIKSLNSLTLMGTHVSEEGQKELSRVLEPADRP